MKKRIVAMVRPQINPRPPHFLLRYMGKNELEIRGHLQVSPFAVSLEIMF
ncbi:MAG: hypothetical protein ACP5P6_06275 [Candidatus Saccharicenans sp.]